MHPHILGVTLLPFLLALSTSPNSRAAAKEAGAAEGQASYLESGAPVVLIHNASLPVDVRCHAGPLPSPENADALVTNSRSHRGTLKPGDHWSINVDPGGEDALFCTFRSALRKWNCDERWLIKDACMWEKFRGFLLTCHQPNPNHQSNSPCPKCVTHNSVGKPICIWTIQNDGIYVKQWDAEKKQDVPNLTHAWREDDPAFYEPTDPFGFSVTNHFNTTVKIQCDVVSEPVFLEGAKESQGPKPKWDYKIHPIMDADYTYFTWTCDFEVLGTMMRRGGVQIWSPQPDVNTWIRTPDCTDCAWKLDEGGLWLDDRSCYTNRPVWIREHLWDYLPNGSAVAEIDLSPYYHPLKRSSHLHHVF